MLHNPVSEKPIVGRNVADSLGNIFEVYEVSEHLDVPGYVVLIPHAQRSLKTDRPLEGFFNEFEYV